MFESERLKEHEGKMYGPYRATVLDNKDPQRLGRLKLNCPSVYGDGIESPWAYCAFSVATSNCGIYVIPPKGSNVWIFLEMGSPDYPVWLGSPYTTGIPNDFKKTVKGKDRSSPNVFGIVTPAGHSLLLDEDADGCEIRIKHKCGSIIKMENDGTIRLIPSNGAVVVAGTLTATTLKSTGSTIVGGSVSVGGGTSISKTSLTTGSVVSDSVTAKDASVTNLKPTSCTLK